jgi:hypothetical protein
MMVFAESWELRPRGGTGRSIADGKATGNRTIRTVMRTVPSQIVIALARTRPSSPTCICSQGFTAACLGPSFADLIEQFDQEII